MKIEWEEELNKRDNKRQELVESAAHLFRQKGFKNTKLDEIASISKKGKTALYYYFKNKKSIFTAVIEWEISKIYQSIEGSTLAGIPLVKLNQGLDDTCFDSLAALDRYVDQVVETGDTFLHKNKSVLLEYNSFQKLIKSIVKAFKEQNVFLLSVVLNHGISHKQIAHDKANLDILAYTIFRICFTYYSDIMQGLDFQVGAPQLRKIVRLLIAS